MDGPQGSRISLGHLLAVLCNRLDVVFEIKTRSSSTRNLISIFFKLISISFFGKKITDVIKVKLFKLVHYHEIVGGRNTSILFECHLYHSLKAPIIHSCRSISWPLHFFTSYTHNQCCIKSQKNWIINLNHKLKNIWLDLYNLKIKNHIHLIFKSKS